MKTIVDAAQLGPQWIGSRAHLQEFARVLSEVICRPVEISDMHNGGDTSGISEEDWNVAVDIHAAKNPEAWGK